MTDNWRDRAACLDQDAEAWFPGPNERGETAKRICNTVCQVKNDCLEHALTHRIFADDSGIWGGLSPRQRIKLKAKGRAA